MSDDKTSRDSKREWRQLQRDMACFPKGNFQEILKWKNEDHWYDTEDAMDDAMDDDSDSNSNSDGDSDDGESGDVESASPLANTGMNSATIVPANDTMIDPDQQTARQAPPATVVLDSPTHVPGENTMIDPNQQTARQAAPAPAPVEFYSPTIPADDAMIDPALQTAHQSSLADDNQILRQGNVGPLNSSNTAVQNRTWPPHPPYIPADDTMIGPALQTARPGSLADDGQMLRAGNVGRLNLSATAAQNPGWLAPPPRPSQPASNPFRAPPGAGSVAGQPRYPRASPGAGLVAGQPRYPGASPGAGPVVGQPSYPGGPPHVRSNFGVYAPYQTSSQQVAQNTHYGHPVHGLPFDYRPGVPYGVTNAGGPSAQGSSIGAPIGAPNGGLNGGLNGPGYPSLPASSYGTTNAVPNGAGYTALPASWYGATNNVPNDGLSASPNAGPNDAGYPSLPASSYAAANAAGPSYAPGDGLRRESRQPGGNDPLGSLGPVHGAPPSSEPAPAPTRSRKSTAPKPTERQAILHKVIAGKGKLAPPKIVKKAHNPNGMACPTCGTWLNRKGDLTDHLLYTHEIEMPDTRTSFTVTKRMKLKMSNRLFQEEARAGNALKRRIAAAEAALSQRDPGYATSHRLDLTMENETDTLSTTDAAKSRGAAIRAARNADADDPTSETKGKITLNTGIMWYNGGELVRLRNAAEQQGRLRDGRQGSYEDVAIELEALLLSLTGSNGDDDDEEVEGEDEENKKMEGEDGENEKMEDAE